MPSFLLMNHRFAQMYINTIVDGIYLGIGKRGDESVSVMNRLPSSASVPTFLVRWLNSPRLCDRLHRACLLDAGKHGTSLPAGKLWTAAATYTKMLRVSQKKENTFNSVEAIGLRNPNLITLKISIRLDIGL